MSATSLYYLGTSPDLAKSTGLFYNLTNVEEPAKHASDDSLKASVYQHSLKLLGEE